MDRDNKKPPEKNIGVLYKIGSTTWWGASSLVMGAVYGVKYLATTALNVALYLGKKVWNQKEVAEQVVDLTPESHPQPLSEAANITGVDKDGFSHAQLYAPGLLATEVGIEWCDDNPQNLDKGVGFISMQGISSTLPDTNKLKAVASNDAPLPSASISSAPGVFANILTAVGLRRRTPAVEQDQGRS